MSAFVVIPLANSLLFLCAVLILLVKVSHLSCFVVVCFPSAWEGDGKELVFNVGPSWILGTLQSFLALVPGDFPVPFSTVSAKGAMFMGDVQLGCGQPMGKPGTRSENGHFFFVGFQAIRNGYQ